MCLECVWGFILFPECLWIILNVSGMLDKASESVWRMCLECVWNVSGMCLECVCALYLVLKVSGLFECVRDVR